MTPIPPTTLVVYPSAYRSLGNGKNPAFRTDAEAARYAKVAGCTIEWGLYAKTPDGRVHLLSWHPTRAEAEEAAGETKCPIHIP
jgi:hypothetical protein